jgi:hypothetical protein
MLERALIPMAVSVALAMPAGAQVWLEPDPALAIPLEACLGEVSVDEWAAAGPIDPTTTTPLSVGESYCNVTRRRGVFKSYIKITNESPNAPFEFGQCYPTPDGSLDECAIFRHVDSAFKVYRVESIPAA